MAGELEQDDLQGLFQPKAVYDSVIIIPISEEHLVTPWLYVGSGWESELSRKLQLFLSVKILVLINATMTLNELQC